MPYWLIKFRKDNTALFSSKRKLKSNQISNIFPQTQLQCNLIEGPFIDKVTGALGDLWGSPEKYLSIGESEVTILKANGGAKEKRM